MQHYNVFYTNKDIVMFFMLFPMLHIYPNKTLGHVGGNMESLLGKCSIHDSVCFVLYDG
jgi:hypothetical protein